MPSLTAIIFQTAVWTGLIIGLPITIALLIGLIGALPQKFRTKLGQFWIRIGFRTFSGPPLFCEKEDGNYYPPVPARWTRIDDDAGYIAKIGGRKLFFNSLGTTTTGGCLGSGILWAYEGLGHLVDSRTAAATEKVMVDWESGELVENSTEVIETTEIDENGNEVVVDQEIPKSHVEVELPTMGIVKPSSTRFLNRLRVTPGLAESVENFAKASQLKFLGGQKALYIGTIITVMFLTWLITYISMGGGGGGGGVGSMPSFLPIG